MKLRTKIIVIISTLLVGMFFFPIISIWVFKDECGMGFMILQFFLINPFICTILSIIAGTDIKHFWFIPLFTAAVFPFLFALIIVDMVWDLFFYSVIYLLIGYIVMFFTYLIKRFSIKN